MQDKELICFMLLPLNNPDLKHQSTSGAYPEPAGCACLEYLTFPREGLTDTFFCQVVQLFQNSLILVRH